MLVPYPKDWDKEVAVKRGCGIDHWGNEMKAVDILVNTSKCLTTVSPKGKKK